MTQNNQPPRPLKPTPRPERQAAFRVGISAESRAAAFLLAKGFRILARRWRSPRGEIDIIARRRRLLVFAEVKARASFDEAAESINERQRRRIAAAAEAWLAANPDEMIRDIRFDAILVATGKIPRHIPAAFRNQLVVEALRRSEELVDLHPDSVGDTAEVIRDRFNRGRACARILRGGTYEVDLGWRSPPYARAAISTPRAISLVAAPCWVTAAAIALLILPISRIVCSMPVIAAIERCSRALHAGDLRPDLLGRAAGLTRQRLHLSGDHGKATSGLSRARGLDGRH